MKKIKSESVSNAAPVEATFFALLRVCLLAMLARPFTCQLARVLLHFLEHGEVELLDVASGRPVFVLAVPDRAEADELISAVDSRLDAAILELCANREVCFWPGVFEGRPDLKFGILGHRSRSARRPYSGMRRSAT